MPKMKSHRSARKTFRVTGTGKIKRHKMNRRHILTSKATKRKRHLRRSGLVSAVDEKNIKRLLVM
jgi:large subunit ribosomal protein L35